MGRGREKRGGILLNREEKKRSRQRHNNTREGCASKDKSVAVQDLMAGDRKEEGRGKKRKKVRGTWAVEGEYIVLSREQEDHCSPEPEYGEGGSGRDLIESQS